MRPDIDYTLYLVTDRNLMSAETLEQAVEEAIEGGVTLVQLREKNVTEDEYLKIAKSVKEVCDEHGVALIINDDPVVAKACGAAGVHVGQEDMAVERARDVLGPDALIGVSAHDVREAVAAQDAGADYLGVGAIASTATKPEAGVLSIEQIEEIIGSVDIPVVVIGGVNLGTIDMLRGTGAAGVSVVSAIIAADDIKTAATRLKSKVEEVLAS